MLKMTGTHKSRCEHLCPHCGYRMDLTVDISVEAVDAPLDKKIRPMTLKGRAAIRQAQTERWRRYRAEKKLEGAAAFRDALQTKRELEEAHIAKQAKPASLPEDFNN